jgi:tRNA pseudouridine38-40 synthase
MARAARRPAALTRYRAVVAYEGTRCYGFQRQAGDTPTIQGEIESAINRVTQQAVTVLGAGRTDSGVHATGQVIAFDVAWNHSTDDLWRAINANLPGDIALQRLDVAQADFHPRYDAHSRVYEYTLVVAPVRQPLLNKSAWHVPSSRPLDVKVMERAAASLIGVHDFATFGQPTHDESTLREVFRSEFAVTVGMQPGIQLIRYTIEANAFLYRMVRRIVGALVRVGSAQLSLAEFEAARRAADGSWPNQTAPAQGLCLIEVTYGDRRGDARWSRKYEDQDLHA